MKKLFNSHYALLALLIIFVTITASEPIYAQKSLTNPSITVTTDKSSYIFGDTIEISGTIKTMMQGNTLTIRILDSYSNLIQTAHPSVAQDGSYSAIMEIEGSSWKSSGVYTVQVQYGSAVQTQTTFAFTATAAPISDTFQVQIPNSQQIFDVPYTISGGSVTKMSVNPSDFSLAVSIKSSNYGSITLSIQRSLLDAKTNDGMDGSFTILLEGEEIKPQRERITSSDRTLTIQFLRGDQNIVIIGTNIASRNISPVDASNVNLTMNQQSSGQLSNMSKLVPTIAEFPLALDVFVISISLIILISVKTRL